MRIIILSALMPLLVFAQAPEKTAQAIPAERRVDTYAVYSAVLAHPALSHPDDNQKYLVVELSGIPMEKDPRMCTVVPEVYRAAFSELLQDRERYQNQFLLEHAFTIPKPYELITEDQAAQFRGLRNVPGHTTDEVELFRGAADLIKLGNVYFDRKRNLAAVYTEAWCGGLCGFWTWRVFVKTGEGNWDEQRWATCMTIAAVPGPLRPLLVRPFVGAPLG